MGKNIGKNISKNLIGKYNQKHLDHAKQSATDILNPSSRRVIQKKQVILLVIKLLIKLRGFEKIHNKIIQRQSKMSMIKKYFKKEIYLQKKNKKLLMN